MATAIQSAVVPSRNLGLLSQTGHAHLIGIGGAGMQALASVLREAKWHVSGSDASPLPSPDASARERIFVGHDAEHLPASATLVVRSDAVSQDNPEVRAALARGLPVLRYPEMLGRLMSERQGLAVAGTHGKSTTTAMLAHILSGAGHEPLVLGGGTPIGATSGGQFGRGECMVAEACEYRSNFLQLRPQAAAILNCEWDHVDCFASLDAAQQAFAKFAAQVHHAGLLVVPSSWEPAHPVLSTASCRLETFGLKYEATHVDWQATNLAQQGGFYGFELLHRGRSVGPVQLRTPGLHNVRNALAAAALGHFAGVKMSQISAGLADFRGVRRRLEILGEPGGVLVMDDYAHHPTEVIAALAAVRQMAPDRRIIAVLQPHQVSRTRAFLDELAASLHNAQKIFVTKVFQAREQPSVEGERIAAVLAERIAARGGDVTMAQHSDELLEQILTVLQPGDVLVTLGAGDIGKLAHAICQRI